MFGKARERERGVLRVLSILSDDDDAIEAARNGIE